jgi:hypothetical protein
MNSFLYGVAITSGLLGVYEACRRYYKRQEKNRQMECDLHILNSAYLVDKYCAASIEQLDILNDVVKFTRSPAYTSIKCNRLIDQFVKTAPDLILNMPNLKFDIEAIYEAAACYHDLTPEPLTCAGIERRTQLRSKYTWLPCTALADNPAMETIIKRFALPNQPPHKFNAVYNEVIFRMFFNIPRENLVKIKNFTRTLGELSVFLKHITTGTVDQLKRKRDFLDACLSEPWFKDFIDQSKHTGSMCKIRVAIQCECRRDWPADLLEQIDIWKTMTHVDKCRRDLSIACFPDCPQYASAQKIQDIKTG